MHLREIQVLPRKTIIGPYSLKKYYTKKSNGSLDSHSTWFLMSVISVYVCLTSCVLMQFRVCTTQNLKSQLLTFSSKVSVCYVTFTQPHLSKHQSDHLYYSRVLPSPTIANDRIYQSGLNLHSSIYRNSHESYRKFSCNPYVFMLRCNLELPTPNLNMCGSM